MSERIKLTEAESKLLDEARERIQAEGLSTERCDRPRAERAILKSAPNHHIVWMQSPKAATTYGPLVATLVKAKPELAEFFSTYDFGNPATPKPAAQICKDAGVRGVPKKFIVTAEKLKEDRIQCSLWLAWWGHCDALRTIFKGRLTFDPQDDADLTDALEISRTCGWVFPVEGHGVIIVTERVSQIHVANGVLHCPNGPAIAWADGFEMFLWRGNVVPREWIMDTKNVEASIALTHPNVELRRCAAEIIGWAKVLEAIPHRVIDKDKNPQIGTLIEADIPDAGPTRFLLVRCATERDFALCVPNDTRTAVEANARTNRTTPDMIRKLEVRT